jgi:DNA polymerase-4/protein ImuB
MRRIACLTVPSLALAGEIAERPELAGLPAVLGDEAGRIVQQVTLQAAQRGVRPGMTLREASGLCPHLVVLEPHPMRAAQAAETLLGVMRALTPVIDQASAGVIYGDLRGLERLYLDEEEVATTVLSSLPRRLGARMGFADRRFTAYAAALAARPGGWFAAPEDERGFLAGKATSWLPLATAEREWLRLLGILRLGEIAALPQAAFEAQLGARAGWAWLAARGEDPTPLTPLPPEQPRTIEATSAEPPLVSRESVLLQAEQLLRRALRRIDQRFVRSVRLLATTEDQRRWERTHVLKEPTGDRARLWLAIRPLLERADYPGPIAGLELELAELTAESGRQPSLITGQRHKREQLDQLIRQLKVRYDHPVIDRIVEREPWSRIPERRFALVDYDP